MAGKYERKNEKTIEKGFKWLTGIEERIARQGMIELLQAASSFAMELHDANHFGHRIAENSHGWALAKDGAIVMMQVNAGNHGEGNAQAELRDAVRSVKSDGYVGVILASMDARREDGRPIMFATDFELDVLHATADEVKANFNRIFRWI